MARFKRFVNEGRKCMSSGEIQSNVLVKLKHEDGASNRTLPGSFGRAGEWVCFNEFLCGRKLTMRGLG